MTGVNGKVVAITGASSEIGEAAGRLLAASGAKVILGARRADRLEAIAADIGKTKGEVDFHVMDVSKREDLAAFVRKAQDRFGRLDVLIGNAGVMPLSPFDDLKVDEWDRMIDVNIKGVLYGIAAALPVFRKQGSGHFINVSSVAGHRVGPNGAVYSGTKFAVRAISEGLRQEAGDKIRVTIISPGAVEIRARRDDIQSRREEAYQGLSKDGYPGRGNRLRDGLRHRTAERGGRQRDINPPDRATELGIL